MRTRSLTFLGACALISSAAFATVACVGGSSDDDDSAGGSAGTAGSAGIAGMAGTGNVSGAGATAGAGAGGGAAGSAGGLAGSNAGGAGNVSGSAGAGNAAGNGGVGNTGNTGGVGNTGNTAGSAGAGNASGDGGVGNTGNTGGVGNTGNTAGSAGSGNTGNTAGQDPGPTLEPGTCQSDLGGYQNGSVTFYTFSMGTELVNCSYGTHPGNPDTVDFVSTNNGQYFAAINTSDYDNAATCGACIEVTRDGNRKVTVTVADQCPIGTNDKCRPGHLDLSAAAFDQIGSRQEGYLGTGNGGMYGSISWKFVPCPTSGNVHFRLKEPSNQAWNQLLVENHTYQIEKVEVQVNGSWVNATRQAYNFWEPPNGAFGTPPYRVRVTDINGTVLEDTVNLESGDQEAENQMTCE